MIPFYDRIRNMIADEFYAFPESYFTLLDEKEELENTIAVLTKEHEEMQEIVKWEGEKWKKYFKVDELEKKVKEYA